MLLHECPAKIQGKEYFVEVSRNKINMFVIAFSIQQAAYSTLQIPIKIAYKLISQCSNNFDLLISKLRFKNGSLGFKQEFESVH